MGKILHTDLETDFLAMRQERIPEKAFADCNTSTLAETQATAVLTEIVPAEIVTISEKSASAEQSAEEMHAGAALTP